MADALKYGTSKIGRKIIDSSPKAVQRAYNKYFASHTVSGRQVRYGMKLTYNFMKNNYKDIKATLKLIKSKKLKVSFKKFKQLASSKNLRKYLSKDGLYKLAKVVKNSKTAQKVYRTFKKHVQDKAKSWMVKQGKKLQDKIVVHSQKLKKVVVKKVRARL